MDEVADAVAGLDMLLADAALGPLRRMVPPAGVTLRLAATLARHPRTGVARGRALVSELAKIGLGRSGVGPGKGDRRFVDPARVGNGALHRAMQAHLASAQTAEEVVADAELDRRDLERVRLAVSNIADALAPSNNPLLNPLGWKALIDRRMVSDLSTPPRVPCMVEPDAFVVGGDLAVTPGAVVFRTPGIARVGR